jgi:hypothetical protein
MVQVDLAQEIIANLKEMHHVLLDQLIVDSPTELDTG